MQWRAMPACSSWGQRPYAPPESNRRFGSHHSVLSVFAFHLDEESFLLQAIEQGHVDVIIDISALERGELVDDVLGSRPRRLQVDGRLLLEVVVARVDDLRIGD